MLVMSICITFNGRKHGIYITNHTIISELIWFKREDGLFLKIRLLSWKI